METYVYVLLEYYWQEVSLIGVVDHPDKALDLIKAYYGDYKELSHYDFRGEYANNPWMKTIETDGRIVTISLVRCKLNSL